MSIHREITDLLVGRITKPVNNFYLPFLKGGLFLLDSYYHCQLTMLAVLSLLSMSPSVNRIVVLIL